jgi:FkbM family methyltransferase
MFEGLRRFVLRILPAPAIRFVRDCKVSWRDRRVVQAFAAIPTAEPVVLYCVGARGGADSVEDLFRRRGKMQIVGFEPEPVEAKRLEADGSMDFTLPYALGDRSGPRTLYVTQHPGCSSLLEPHPENVRLFRENAEWFRVERQTTVEVVRLDEVVARHSLPPPEMLEIDVQGFEYEVLAGCGALLEQVRCLSLELHYRPVYRGEKTFCEVTEWLATQGFYLSMVRRRGSGEVGVALTEVDACFFNERRMDESPRNTAIRQYWKARYGVG